MPKLALLDGHSLAYRAFYALPTDLSTRAGQVTNAVYGFTSMVIKLLDDEEPDAVVVAWDTPEKTFRSDEYPEYKAQREAAPDLFREQLPLIREVVAALGFPQYAVPGYEADDVIATAATEAVAEGWDVLVVTGDRDAFQLIDDEVGVLYTRRGITDTIVADAAYVQERYGIGPDRYVDYAALRGDTSDNLPGVPGVGEKTATKLLQSYGTLEGIYEHLEEQTPKLKENLAASRDQVFLNRRLMTLLRDAPVDVDFDDVHRTPWNPAEVKEVFDALEFTSLWPRLVEVEGGGAAAGGEVLEVEVAVERDPDRIAAFVSSSLALEAVWDTAGLTGVVVATDRGAIYVPWDDVDALGPALQNPELGIVVHDAKPVMRALLEVDIDLRGIACDTALAAYVINPGQRAPDVADLAMRYLGLEVEPADDVDSGGGDQGALDFGGDGPDLEGAARRAEAVRRLAQPLLEQVEGRGSDALFREVELPLVRVLARMEEAGIGVDREYLEELGSNLRDRLATLERSIHEAAGEPFNVNSTLQLRKVLFEDLGLPVLKKTPKGAPSTDASVLVKLGDEHPIVADLLSYRELEKLRGTYIDGLLPLIEDDGRIHTRFNQMAAATGRLSSDRPNLQNIPVRSEEGRTVRRAFVAEPNHVFIAADYSQIELRILAHLSEDPGLLEAFAGDADVHLATAARVFDIAPEAVQPDQRRKAKVINFGLLYGMEAYGLAQRLEIGRDEAQAHMDAYFAQFPQVEEFLQGIVNDARATGYTTTLLGRRRYLPELASGNFRQRQMGERMALNAPIQGSAADIIKKAMIDVDRELEAAGDTSRLLLQVHDELVLEAPEADAAKTIELLRSIMESVVPLKVPLRVDIASAANWAECK